MSRMLEGDQDRCLRLASGAGPRAGVRGIVERRVTRRSSCEPMDRPRRSCGPRTEGTRRSCGPQVDWPQLSPRRSASRSRSHQFPVGDMGAGPSSAGVPEPFTTFTTQSSVWRLHWGLPLWISPRIRGRNLKNLVIFTIFDIKYVC